MLPVQISGNSIGDTIISISDIKKTKLKELSEEYEMVKWSVISRVMDMDEKECKIMAHDMELFWFE